MKWIVIRIIEQKFEIESKGKEEAMRECIDPYSVRIIKEIIQPQGGEE